MSLLRSAGLLSVLTTSLLVFTNECLADSKPLTDDVSRGVLGEYAVSLLPGTDKGIVRNFQFPRDAQDAIYGVDVSHHNGAIDWDTLPGVGVTFAFIKISQGASYYDSASRKHWADLTRVQRTRRNIYKGTYHFLNAADSAEEQAANYIQRMRASGGLSSQDLPPVLDLEWDPLVQNGRVVKDDSGQLVDQWKNMSGTDIAERAATWLRIVETELHRKPIIYTNASWWNERIGADERLRPYPLWIADYSNSSFNNGRPKLPNGFTYVMWQFTDRGTAKDKAGRPMRMDVNYLNGNIQQIIAASNLR